MKKTFQRSLRDVRKRVLVRTYQRLRFRGIEQSGLPVLFANSFPKSGTNLLRQILSGFTDLGPFVDLTDQAVLVYEVSTGRHRSQQEIMHELQELQPGDIAAGHVHASKETIDALVQPGIVNYFIFRDPRDVVISHAHYVGEMAPEHVHHEYYTKHLQTLDEKITVSIQGLPDAGVEFPDIAQRFQPFMEWFSYPEVLKIRFEDVILNRTAELQRICDHVSANSSFEFPVEDVPGILDARIDPAQSPTFRSGKVGEWQQNFSKQHKDLFKEVAGDLLVWLGYEKDHDW